MNYFVCANFIFLVLFFAFSIAVPTDDDDSFLAFVRDLPKNRHLYEKDEDIEKMITTLFEQVIKQIVGKENSEEKKKNLIMTHLNGYTYHANLGILFLMRDKGNWNCAKKDVIPFKDQCEKYDEYKDVLYEYVFQVYYQANQPEKQANLAQKFFGAIKSMFCLEDEPIIDVINCLNNISCFLFNIECRRRMFSNEFESVFFNYCHYDNKSLEKIFEKLKKATKERKEEMVNIKNGIESNKKVMEREEEAMKGMGGQMEKLKKLMEIGIKTMERMKKAMEDLENPMETAKEMMESGKDILEIVKDKIEIAQEEKKNGKTIMEITKNKTKTAEKLMEQMKEGMEKVKKEIENAKKKMESAKEIMKSAQEKVENVKEVMANFEEEKSKFDKVMESMSEIAKTIKKNGGKVPNSNLKDSGIGLIWNSPFLPIDDGAM